MNNRITGRISFRSLLLLPLLIAGILTILASGSGGGSGGAESDCIVICEPLSPATYRAYINNMNDGTISVVDFTSSSLVSLTDPTVTVVGAFPKGGMGAGGILKISSLSPKLYVVNADSNTVSVIDKTTRTVMTTIPVGNNPLGIARGPLGFEEVYVANRDDDTVSVIDPTTDSVTATIAVGDGPYAFAVGINTLYVANEAPSTPGMGTVSVIDLNTRTVTATVAVGGAPHGIAFYSNSIYVSNTAAGVSVIDTSTNTVTATIPIMGSLQNIVAVGKYRIYVANQTTGTVVLISPSTNTVVATIPVSASANSPLGLTVVYEPFFSEDNDILATNPDDETISVINKYSSVIDTIAVGHGPYALLIELK